MKQFGSRSGRTFYRAWPGSKLFAKVVSRWQKLSLTSKKIKSSHRHFMRIHRSNCLLGFNTFGGLMHRSDCLLGLDTFEGCNTVCSWSTLVMSVLEVSIACNIAYMWSYKVNNKCATQTPMTCSPVRNTQWVKNAHYSCNLRCLCF